MAEDAAFISILIGCQLIEVRARFVFMTEQDLGQ